MKLVIEALNTLLEEFDLPADIFGYIGLLSALSCLVLAALLILVCIAKQIRTCNQTQFEDFNI